MPTLCPQTLPTRCPGTRPWRGPLRGAAGCFFRDNRGMHTTPALTTTTPIVLFAHGSRDPRWAQTLDHLQTALEQQAAAQGRTCVVRQAFLELMEPPLPQVLAQLGAEGATQVAVLPVFWSAGSHVLGDLPALIAQAQADYPQLQVQTWPVLSRWPGLLDWLAGQALAQLSE